MEDFGDDQQTFDTLDAELARINDKFEKGQMRAFGACFGPIFEVPL